MSLKNELCLAAAGLILGCFIMDSTARTYYVDHETGNDHYSGLFPEANNGDGPFKSIRRATGTVKAGDEIKLIPKTKPYLENVVFYNQSGAADKPIVFDGQMAVLRGSCPLSAEKWRSAGEGRFKVKLNLPETVLVRFFLVINGKINRMNRTLKGKSAPLKSPDELQDGEWTYLPSEQALYVRLPDDSAPEEIDLPILSSSGVEISGACSNLIIKNLVVEYFWNDGYNIHGDCKNISFKNIMARFNGDDGISAHETCEISVTNFISCSNGAGLCHIGNSRSVNSNILICGISGIEILLLNPENIFNNLVVIDNSHNGVNFNGKSLNISDAVFINNQTNHVSALFNLGRLIVSNCRFAGYQVKVDCKQTSGKITEEAFSCKTPDPLARRIIVNLQQIFGGHFPNADEGLSVFIPGE